MGGYSNIRIQEYNTGIPYLTAGYNEVIISCVHVIDPNTGDIKWYATYGTPVLSAPIINYVQDPHQTSEITRLTSKWWEELQMRQAMERFIAVKGLTEDYNRLYAAEQVKREMAFAVKATLDAQPLPEEVISGSSIK
jgi:hypothetical protein